MPEPGRDRGEGDGAQSEGRSGFGGRTEVTLGKRLGTRCEEVAEWPVKGRRALTLFVEVELGNQAAMEREAICKDRWDEMPPAGTLDSALGSWVQAPGDVRTQWCGDIRPSGLAAIEAALRGLAASLGGDCELGTLLEEWAS